MELRTHSGAIGNEGETEKRFLHVVLWHSSDPTPTPTPMPTSRDVTNQAGYVAEKRCHDDEH